MLVLFMLLNTFSLWHMASMLVVNKIQLIAQLNLPSQIIAQRATNSGVPFE